MLISRSLFSLRNVLLVDAATCAAMGIVLTVGAVADGELTRIPATLLFYAGLILLPIAAFMGLVATRPAIPTAGAWLVVAGNVVWIAASLIVLGADWIAPNALGVGFIVAQAVVVGVLATLEHSTMPPQSRIARTS